MAKFSSNFRVRPWLPFLFFFLRFFFAVGGGRTEQTQSLVVSWVVLKALGKLGNRTAAASLDDPAFDGSVCSLWTCGC
jgi:hypothetical protein